MPSRGVTAVVLALGSGEALHPLTGDEPGDLPVPLEVPDDPPAGHEAAAPRDRRASETPSEASGGGHSSHDPGPAEGDDLPPHKDYGACEALLPVANRPLLHYPLRSLEELFAEDPDGLARCTIVVPGEVQARAVRGYLLQRYKGSPARPEVVVAEGGASEGEALRGLMTQGRLAGDNVLVVRGSLVTDLPLREVAAQHLVRGPVLTAVLSPRSSPVEQKLGKAPKNVRYIGLSDDSPQQLVFWGGAVPGSIKELALTKGMLFPTKSATIRIDLADSEIYLFARDALETVLREDPHVELLGDHLIPRFVRKQFLRPAPPSGHRRLDSVDMEKLPDPAVLKRDEQEAYLEDLIKQMSHVDSKEAVKAHCGVYVGGERAYCMNVHSLQTYSEVSRDLANPMMAKIHGHTLAGKNNFVADSVELGNKSTIGGGCIVGDGTRMGEKSSIKRSVIGANCQLGNNVKVVNSVLMDGVVVEDGSHVQNCTICPNVEVQAKSSLKDCQIARNYVVPAGSDERGEVLTV